MKYLNEDRLGEYLKSIYPNLEFIHDKIVPNSGIRNRPDFRNDDIMLIVEFDGYQHYTTASVILTDLIKDTVYTNMGYKIVRIPYFVQLSRIIILNLFNVDINFDQIYPHGFHDRNAILPADYCELGIDKFKLELIKFNYITGDIIKSLRMKCKCSEDDRLILPRSLTYLLN